jgi:hypothetical protein
MKIAKNNCLARPGRQLPAPVTVFGAGPPPQSLGARQPAGRRCVTQYGPSDGRTVLGTVTVAEADGHGGGGPGVGAAGGHGHRVRRTRSRMARQSWTPGGSYPSRRSDHIRVVVAIISESSPQAAIISESSSSPPPPPPPPPPPLWPAGTERAARPELSFSCWRWSTCSESAARAQSKLVLP